MRTPRRCRAARDADVLVAHEPAVAERLIERRRPGQQVWLMMHAPMPFAPRYGMELGRARVGLEAGGDVPDTRTLDPVGARRLRARVDRLITPCSEAVARAGARRSPLRATVVRLRLTGAAGRRQYSPTRPAAASGPLAAADSMCRSACFWAPAPYRGLDLLMEAVGDAARVHSRRRRDCRAAPRQSAARIRAFARLGVVPEITDLLRAVDFVVNVNRFSLFDLSTIEAAEAGRPMLLHSTGGNRRFAQLGVGCVLVDDVDAGVIARGLSDLFTMSVSERGRLGSASRACYEAHLRPSLLLARHRALARPRCCRSRVGHRMTATAAALPAFAHRAGYQSVDGRDKWIVGAIGAWIDAQLPAVLAASPAGSVLDAGCGELPFRAAIAAAGRCCVGMDVEMVMERRNRT